MNWQAFLETVWGVLNSPAAIAAVAAVVLWLLNRLYAARPAWRKYEGSIIAAIKYAEKAIPDDAESKALQRLDAALKYVLAVHRETESRGATAKEVAELREGIQIKHAELEAAGNLAKSPSSPAPVQS